MRPSAAVPSRNSRTPERGGRRFPSRLTRRAAPFALLLLMPAVTALAFGDKDEKKFDPGPASSYTTRQTNGKVTVAAVPYTSDEQARTAFGKHNPYQYGILPVLVIVQNDRQRESFLAAYELATGEQVWKVERDEFPSWATPLVVNGAAGAELVVNASKFVRAYDPMTGRELWRMADAETQVKVPSPVAGPGSVIVTGGYPRGSRPIYAIKPGTRGVIDSAATQGFAWRGDKGSPYVPTPLVYGKELYVLADNGVLTVYDAATGERRYQQRLDETPLGFSASPVGAGGHVYLASEDGDVYVVKAGPAFELVARNDMNESLMATPAIAGSMLVVRGRTHVFGIL